MTTKARRSRRTVGIARGARSVITILTTLTLVGSLATPSGAYQRPGRTELVSVASDGTQADNGYTYGSDITPDGRYITFDSPATNLVPDDTNTCPELSNVHRSGECRDVFVRDRKTNETQRISIASDGLQAESLPDPVENGSLRPSISANGRYIAFESHAHNLVPGDTNLALDVFVHDRKNGATKRVSVSSRGEEPEIGSYTGGSSISANGRYVAFESSAKNLVQDDTNDAPDIFVHDLKTRGTIRVNVGSEGEEANAGGGGGASISANGRFVTFTSDASNLVSDDTNGARDVFVHDLKSGKTRRVSVTSDGSQTQCPLALECVPVGSVIDHDGRYVSFQSAATNLVPNDTNLGSGVGFYGGSDIFVHDLKTRRTERLSVSSSGEEREYGGNYFLRVSRGLISPSGRYVTFDSREPSETTPPELFGPRETFVYDRETGALEWVSVAVNGRRSQDSGSSTAFTVASRAVTDRGHVVFQGNYSDLVTGDSNDGWDVFLREFGPPVGAEQVKTQSPPKEGDPPDDRICVIPDLCIPPGGAISSSDDADDLDSVLTNQGANLYGTSLAYRQQYSDLFIKIELEHMPKVIPGASPIFYGLRLNVEEMSYEVRATSLFGGTFGLFDCTASSACEKVTDLKGGYGTTGMRVVFSLPLEQIGLEKGGRLQSVEVFSGVGSYLTGAVKILDRISLK